MSIGRPGSGTGVSRARRTGWLSTFSRKKSVHRIVVVSVLLLGLLLIAVGLCFHAVVLIGMGIGLVGVGVTGGFYLRPVKRSPMRRPGLGEPDR